MAVALRPVRPVTDEDLMERSERNPGYQSERTAAGALIVTPTSGRSGHLEARLVRQVDVWADQDGRGLAFDSTTGFVLPDTAWVRRERWDALDPDARDDILHLCPDAALKVRPRTDRPTDLQDKTRTYIANGPQIAVLIGPHGKTVEGYRPDRELEAHRNPVTVALDPELPGCVLVLEP